MALSRLIHHSGVSPLGMSEAGYLQTLLRDSAQLDDVNLFVIFNYDVQCMAINVVLRHILDGVVFSHNFPFHVIAEGGDTLRDEVNVVAGKIVLARESYRRKE